MRFVLVAAAALAALTAAFALPAGAHVAAPGPQCGGTLWKLMTLSDTGKTAVHWAPTATTLPDIAKLSAPAKITTARSSAFQKQVWKLTAVIQSYRRRRTASSCSSCSTSDVAVHERVHAEPVVPPVEGAWPGADGRRP